MSKLNFLSVHSKQSLGDIGDFEVIHPQANCEATQDSSITTQKSAAEDSSKTNSQMKMLNDEIDSLVSASDNENIAGNKPKSREDSLELLTTRTSSDIDGSTSENPEKLSTSENIPVKLTTTLTPDSPEKQQELEKNQRIDEVNYKAEESEDGTTFTGNDLMEALEEFNNEREDGTTVTGNDIMKVLDEFSNERKIIQRDKLLQYLQTQPGATAQYPGAIKALDYLQDKDEERIQHFSNLVEYMNRLQSNKKLCDVEIHIDNDVFHAHRIALSCFSPYFYDLFSKRKVKCNVPITLKLYGISSEAFQVFLDYVYNREFNVNSEILAEVITMADTLSAPILKERCQECLSEVSSGESLPTSC